MAESRVNQGPPSPGQPGQLDGKYTPKPDERQFLTFLPGLIIEHSKRINASILTPIFVFFFFFGVVRWYDMDGKVLGGEAKRDQV